MDLTFDKNSIGKDHPDFIYDKQVQFQPSSGIKTDWDDDSSEERSGANLIEAPKDTVDSADDFWWNIYELPCQLREAFNKKKTKKVKFF